MTATLVAAAGLPARAEVTTGTISGQITSASSGWVNVYNTSYTWNTGTNINADGTCSVQVPAGAYKLEISVDGLSQWAYQKTDFSQADTFTVTAGSVLTVNETLLPTGSLVGTLLDGATPVAGVSVSAQPADGHRPSSAFTDQQGRFVMRLLPGQYRIAFYLDSGLVQYYRQQVDINLAELVTITDGESTEITEMVRPSGSVAGRLTEDGVGVAGAQVFWRQGEFVTVSAITDGDGHYRLLRLFAGEYTVMFWLPDQRSQWAHGKISEESAGFAAPAAETDADGRYTFANLGLYDWPLHFGHAEYAGHWSGGVPSRLLAETVKVKAGKTVTPGAADAALTTGTVVRGTARRASGGAVPSGFVTAYEAATRDFAGTGWLNNGTYEMRVFGPTLVRFNVDESAGINGWHREAEDFAHAAAVFVPSSGTTTIDVVVS